MASWKMLLPTSRSKMMTSMSLLRHKRIVFTSQCACCWTRQSLFLSNQRSATELSRMVTAVSAAPVMLKQQRRTIILRQMIQEPATGHNLPGQGLKKITPEEDKLMEENSVVLRYLNRKIKQQEEGREKFPLLPDYRFLYNLLMGMLGLILLGIVTWPDIKILLFDLEDIPTVDKAIAPDKVDSFAVYIYQVLPLRFLSRLLGRVMDVEMRLTARKYILGLFVWLTGVNIEEALVQDLSYYKSVGSFFRRPIDPKCRPINEQAAITSPADGKVLVSGTVNKGEIEQIKGVTYSLQKFLGPLTSDPVHENWSKDPKQNWSIAPLDQYQSGLMHDPVNNSLFQCVIYLAPGDYHRFHSPCEWVMKHRRHFPGELLSVNPKIASWIKDLFVLNERVVLSGTWKHGYFSLTAVGATNVGSIKIYDDLLLKTNPVKWKSGTYYDVEFEDGGCKLEKGELIGEFNLGSTIVLVFEAPKDFALKLEDGEKLKFGEGISK